MSHTSFISRENRTRQGCSYFDVCETLIVPCRFNEYILDIALNIVVVVVIAAAAAAVMIGLVGVVFMYQAQVDSGVPLATCLHLFSRWIEELRDQYHVYFAGEDRPVRDKPLQRKAFAKTALATWSGSYLIFPIKHILLLFATSACLIEIFQPASLQGKVTIPPPPPPQFVDLVSTSWYAL